MLLNAVQMSLSLKTPTYLQLLARTEIYCRYRFIVFGNFPVQINNFVEQGFWMHVSSVVHLCNT